MKKIDFLQQILHHDGWSPPAMALKIWKPSSQKWTNIYSYSKSLKRHSQVQMTCSILDSGSPYVSEKQWTDLLDPSRQDSKNSMLTVKKKISDQ